MGRSGSTGVLVFAILFAASILIGCGAAPNGAFSASPAAPSSGTSGSSNGSSDPAPVGGSSDPTPATATAVDAVAVASTPIAAGTSSSATVTLNAAAPAGGAQVALTSSNASAASVPASVTVAADQTAGRFTVTTGNVTSDTSVTITAGYNNTVAGMTVSVKAPAAPPTPPPPPPPPPTSISVSISPSSASLLGGASQQFTATVTGSTNTAVRWTTTGGNITSTGLFTAPSVSASTTVTVFATSQADTSVVETAQVTVTPAPAPPPPPGGGGYTGTGPVASWKAYQYRDTDNLYHQGIQIYNAQGLYPVIGYSGYDSTCSTSNDTFNDFWQPIGNGIWWFINRPNLIYVKWVWYNNSTDRQILQQTPCMDYSGAPKYN
jgi:hypothetical protein